MRFDLPESIAAMRSGRKTQTRRRNVAFWLKKKYGSRITIVHQGEYLGWARVSRVRAQRLGDMTEPEGRAEGYRSLSAFYDAWGRLYGTRDMGEMVVAISFYDVHWNKP